MNADGPHSEREALEMKITALLMGELSPEEATALESQIAADPTLAALRARLSQAADLLHEARALPHPLQLSKERREKLLATFRGIAALPEPVVQVARKREEVRIWASPVLLAALVIIGAIIAALSMPASSSFSRRAEKVARKEQEESELVAVSDSADRWGGRRESLYFETRNVEGPGDGPASLPVPETPSLSVVQAASGPAPVTEFIASNHSPNVRHWPNSLQTLRRPRR